MKKLVNERSLVLWEIVWLFILIVSLKADDAVSPLLSLISILIVIISPFVISLVLKFDDVEEKIISKNINPEDIKYIKEEKCSFKLPSIKTLLNNEEYYKMLNSEEMKDLTIPIGINELNNVVYQNFYDNPNLLIGGVDESGKTTYIKTVINSLLFYNKPSDVKFIIIDFNNNKYNMYANIPHLYTNITKSDERAVNKLKNILEETENRIDLFNILGYANIVDYNTKNPNKKMQKIIIVLDELYKDASDEIKNYIKKITKIGYKVGIYTIMSLNMDIVDKKIEDLGYSFSYKLSFRVPTESKSNNILHEKGAEKLKEKREALLQTSYNETVTKIIVPTVSPGELKKIADIWAQKNERTK